MAQMRIGWAVPLARHEATTQRRALLDAGVDRVLVLGEKLQSGRVVDWDRLMRTVREGDTVIVADGRALMLGKPGSATPRKRLFAGLQTIEKAGAWVETLTGKSNRTSRARDCLVIAILDHDAKTSGKPGRPRVQPTPDELAWMMPIWTSLRVPTNEAARDMIRAEAAKRGGRWQKVSVQQLINKLGGSGRDRIKRRTQTR